MLIKLRGTVRTGKPAVLFMGPQRVRQDSVNNDKKGQKDVAPIMGLEHL